MKWIKRVLRTSKKAEYKCENKDEDEEKYKHNNTEKIQKTKMKTKAEEDRQFIVDSA